jgi:hypothetical protein
VHTKFHVCQYNRARAVAALEDPRLADFVRAQDALYAVSESSPGFVWRLTDPADGTGSVRPFEDKLILAGLSVWKDVPSLKSFVYGQAHADLLRRRRAWFEPHAGPNYVLWWTRAGHLPTVAEGEERLAHLRAHGPSVHAFDFKAPYPPPVAVIGTLGPAGTNSEKAAREYLTRTATDGELLLFDTFEEVVERLLDGTLHKAVVCTAYLKFSALYFERVPRLRMTEAFVTTLHPMVVAAKPGSVRSGRPSFALQPAILPLVRRHLAEGQVRPAASNASAAHDVAKGKADACLTTEVAAQACGLEIVSRMLPLQIPFVVFERSNSTEALPCELHQFLNPTSTNS